MVVNQSTLRRGIYRVDGVGGLPNWAQVEDVNGGSSMPLDEDIYRQRRYQPPYESLPTRAEYEASRNAQRP